MLGVCKLERARVNLDLPKVLVDKIDAYRATLINPVGRNHIIRQACIEYLRARGYEVVIPEHDNAES